MIIIIYDESEQEPESKIPEYLEDLLEQIKNSELE